MRLHPNTPARKALSESIRPAKKPRGKPQYTWITLIREDLKSIGITLNLAILSEVINTLTDITSDRDKWRQIVCDIVAQRCR